MSHRPIEAKKRRRVAKKLRRQPLPIAFDLWAWLITHGYAKTNGEAKALILAKRVKQDSHVVGIEKLPQLQPDMTVEEVDTAMRYVPSHFRANLVVSAA